MNFHRLIEFFTGGKSRWKMFAILYWRSFKPLKRSER